MEGVVGDGARIPERGMFPGCFANDERGLLGPGLHAAPSPLADHGAEVARMTSNWFVGRSSASDS